MKRLILIMVGLGIAFPTMAAPGPADQRAVNQLIELAKQGKSEPQRVEQALVARDQLNNILIDDKESLERRWLSAMAIARLGGADSQMKLLQHLSHSVFLVRMAAIKGLELMVSSGNLPAADLPRLVEALQNGLKDPAAAVRAAAAETLGNLGQRSALPLLIQELTHSRNFYKGRSLFVRRHIVEAIGKMGGVETLPPLLNCLRENDPELVASAFQALNPIDLPSPARPHKEAWLKWWVAQQPPLEPLAPSASPLEPPLMGPPIVLSTSPMLGPLVDLPPYSAVEPPSEKSLGIVTNPTVPLGPPPP